MREDENAFAEVSRESVVKFIDYMKDKAADSAWLVAVLASYDPDCVIFTPGYKYVRPEKEVVQRQ